ncbi:MAG: kelch repeat-containing protein, partial [Candidatus Hodarchaeota archaeon]
SRCQHSMVYDSSSDRVILFGGLAISGRCDDTWVYDLATNTWTEHTPLISPTARSRHTMVYDSSFDKVILFGGWDGARRGDTWVYDLVTNTWTEQTPLISPSARYGHSMVYDSSSGLVILFAGTTSTGWNDQTWVYDLLADTWILKNPSISPSARYHHSMVYDSSSDRVILFGGDSGIELNDTWVYDLTSDTWAPRSPASSPCPRYFQSMVFDSSSDRIILFGGRDASGSYLGDTWLYSLFEYQPKGIFESKITDLGDIYHITGGITWNPFSQPIITELLFQICFSNTTNDEDFHYTNSSSSDFSFTGFAQYLRYKITFKSDDKQYYSPLVKSVHILYSLEQPALSVPSIPLNLLAAIGNNFIELRWIPPDVDGDSSITHYNVYRGTKTGEYIFLGITINPSFTDSSIIPNTTYYYIVTAVNSVGESSFSNEVSITLPATSLPAPTVSSIPQSLSAISGDNFVSLSWTFPSDDGGSAITRYNVYRGTTSGEYMFIGISTSTTFNDTLVLGDTTYYYVVTALNAIGESAFSTEVSVTPTGVTVPKSGTFPSFVILLIFLGTLVVITRKLKKK